MSAIVVMSGGQDSTTCLGVAMQQTQVVLAVTYDYGQKHRVEIEQAIQICDYFDIDHLIVDLKPVLKNMESSALVNHGDTSSPHPYLPDLPASFVPARNALFLTIAYGLAMEYKANLIYAGMCQTDYSGYPDCRNEFIELLNDTLNIGYSSKIKIITPLMFLDKADTFRLAETVGILDTIIDMTMTCYEASEEKHVWGMGCGTCPACKLRAGGWEVYQERYRAENA